MLAAGFGLAGAVAGLPAVAAGDVQIRHPCVGVDRDAPSTLRVVGIVWTVDHAFALLEDAVSNRLCRVDVGDRLDDWRVSALAPDRMVLVRGSERRELAIRSSLNLGAERTPEGADDPPPVALNFSTGAAETDGRVYWDQLSHSEIARVMDGLSDAERAILLAELRRTLAD